MAFPPPLLLLLQLLLLLGAAHTHTHWQDLQLLQHLKAAISPASVPPGSCVHSWDFSADPCSSLYSTAFTCGFRCDVVSNSSSRLSELTLDPAGYSANISAVDWSGLASLQVLDLSANAFFGSLPDSLSALVRLQRLALSQNSLSGSIPASLASLSGLQELFLDGNYLSAALPPTLNGLKNLKRLELQGNNLSGALPDLGQLSSLEVLDASDNSLTGGIPVDLPPALVELALRNNQLEGNIPASVAALPSLQVVDLSHNRLTGSVPVGLFAHQSLEQLTLSYNRLESVQDPGDLALTSQLISVDLSNNGIRGFLPGFMGSMPRLSALSLENNKLSGLIPAEYVVKVEVPRTGMEPGEGVAQLERLLLGGNYLYGPLPGQFLELKAGTVTVRLGNNCLYRCPMRLFFCEGGVYRSRPWNAGRLALSSHDTCLYAFCTISIL